LLSGDFEIRKSFTAGVAGTPDDVAIFAAGAVPGKMRILAVEGVVATAIVATTLQVRTLAGGLGTLVGEIAGTPAGHQSSTSTVTATQVVTPGPTIGLFLRRSDRGVAGEVIIRGRYEQ
jgi:hypothetical protein